MLVPISEPPKFLDCRVIMLTFVFVYFVCGSINHDVFGI